MTTNPAPQSGRLATHEDLELIMDQQAWLQATNPGVLGPSDAWAIGNTDCAFAFNNTMCVQMSHESNRWLDGHEPIFAVKGGFQLDLRPVIPQDLSLIGRGLYIYVSKGPYVIMELDSPVVSTVVVQDIVQPNSGDEPFDFKYTYTNTTSSETSLTVSETTGLKVDSKFELGGFSFGVEASFDRTNTTANTQSHTRSTEINEGTTIKPHTNFHYKVSEVTTTKQTLYGLDFRIGSEVSVDGTITGGIAKATQWSERGDQLTNWDRSFPIEKIANTLQTAKYHVTTQEVVTRIENSVTANTDAAM
ncbi:hypothetical protein LTR15_012951 [Elasticomyces elasticus]|nr:hypothetical protein LTR15_012951 [Elasticomyces elasticus]